MTTPPSGTRAEIINNLIVGLKAGGHWSQLDVFYVFAAHAEDAALLNWRNPATHVPAGVSSPTFTADEGFAGDGAASYVRTNYTPSTEAVSYAQDNASMWAWCRTNAAAANTAICGGGNSGNLNLINPRNASDLMSYVINDNTASTVSNTDSTGFFGVTRSVATTQEAWKNGASLGSAAVTSVGLPAREQYICCYNLGGTASAFTTRQIAGAAWGASLAGLESVFYSRLLTYMQAVGAA